ncbi:hypothetical protein GOARA_013_00290 [Gordonia araii NBRC 100433]|uniref:Uncharacterized protein n=1 Tax=Gordonia araii NBRC 100433 TaxID=1073574 RepID=G7GYB0_9ACTN|nr:response regulator transcription factor [Gordonia araii]NNG97417.1 response regulator transcription factor [Gordonia araii NBRC 100433]GAB08585.1 hypothetical protein GOARA_013_00290 [Gordonia araii NBRC 100433]
MDSGLRILIASPLGDVVAAPLRTAFAGAHVVVAHDRDAVADAIAARVRFDVVSADLVFNHPAHEWTFDGLDVIEMLIRTKRTAPVLLARQGTSIEADLLAEAVARTDVAGVVSKSDGLQTLIEALRAVAFGQGVRYTGQLDNRPSLYEHFSSRRGTTAGRLAGAIASGAAVDNASLATAAKVSANTASKVAPNYLGPIMLARREHDDRLPLTQAAVYRWCGLHARYIVSWCRRNGHEDVLAPLPA